MNTTFRSLIWIALIFSLTILASCSGGGGEASNKQNYTVAYSGNGNDGGSVPLDSTKYLQGQTVTVLGNTGNLVKSSYAFTGWNTQVDGLGTSYAQGQTLVVGSADITLYAKWTANPTYTVTYDGNGNTGGDAPVDSTHYEQGQTVTVLGNAGNLTRTGYTFAGWSMQFDGNGATFWQNDTFIVYSANVTLFAKWESYPVVRQNAEAEQLSIEATGALTAPQVVYDRVVRDLDSIRAAYPSTVNITARPSWNLQQLIIGLTDSAKTAVMDGSYTAWNGLNSAYGVIQIDKSLLNSYGAVNLTFSGRYNIPLVAAEYAGLTGVRYAEPNGVLGDGNDVCLSIDNGGNHFFIFEAASGDCPSGCTQGVYQGIVVAEDGVITDLGTWDSTSGLPLPSWLTDAAACTAWL